MRRSLLGTLLLLFLCAAAAPALSASPGDELTGTWHHSEWSTTQYGSARTESILLREDGYCVETYTTWDPLTGKEFSKDEETHSWTARDGELTVKRGRNEEDHSSGAYTLARGKLTWMGVEYTRERLTPAPLFASGDVFSNADSRERRQMAGIWGGKSQKSGESGVFWLNLVLDLREDGQAFLSCFLTGEMITGEKDVISAFPLTYYPAKNLLAFLDADGQPFLLTYDFLRLHFTQDVPEAGLGRADPTAAAAGNRVYSYTHMEGTGQTGQLAITLGPSQGIILNQSPGLQAALKPTPTPTFTPMPERPVYKDWTYSVMADGTAVITGYLGMIQDAYGWETSDRELVVFPSEVNGVPVRMIGNAFTYCDGLRYAVIPEGVTEIAEHAFYRCDDLEIVWVPASVTKIGYDSFFAEHWYGFSIRGPEGSYVQEWANKGGTFMHSFQVGSPEEAVTPLSAMLRANDPLLLFGRYNFVLRYVEDVKPMDVFLLGVKNWKSVLESALKGGLFDVEAVADHYMNDPVKARSLLRTAVDNLIGAAADVSLAGTQRASGQMGAVAVMMEALLGESVEQQEIEAAKDLLDMTIPARNRLRDYDKSIMTLETLLSVTPEDTVLHNVAEGLLKDYRTYFISDFIRKKADYKNPAEWISTLSNWLLKTKFDAVDTVLQALLKGHPVLEGLDRVIGLSPLKYSAIRAFLDAAEVIRSGDYTVSDKNDYIILFALCRELTLGEYRAMLDGYPFSSREAAYLRDQIAALEGMTYDSFTYAIPFDSYPSK